MKRARILFAALALVTVMVTGTADAATPSGGTLSKKVRSLKWSGSFVLSEPGPDSGCNLPDPDAICDHFALKVDLPDGVRIRVDLPAAPAGDWDLFVMNADGAEVGRSGNLPGERERVDFVHRGRYRNKPYDVQVVPWLVAPGTSYTATAKVK